MLQKETLRFLQDIRIHNNKPWFEKNRQRFENAREDFTDFISVIINDLGKSDPDIALLEARNCIFRQNRDIRFSKDKTPYKVSMGAYMNKGGKRINTPGYYFHVEPGKSFVAGGLYQPASAELAKVRQEIDYNLPEWQALFKNVQFKKYFPNGLDKNDVLSRPPKGYDENNPAIEYLKLKSFTVSQPLSDTVLLDPSIKRTLLNSFKSIHPLISFLNRAIE